MTDEYSVIFSGVEGMTELNDGVPRRIEKTGAYTFKIGPVKGEYIRGGYWSSVPVKREYKFVSLGKCLDSPVIQYRDFETDSLSHLCFVTLGHFVKSHSRYPKPYNKKDAEEFYSIAKGLNEKHNYTTLNEKFIHLYSYTCSGNLNPTCTFIGAVVAQEALKSGTKKYEPITQFLYFDSKESIPNPLPEEEDCQPQDSRYDGQIAVFGGKFQDKIGNCKSFIVGAGALGCEYLKNYAMMGISCGPKGKTYVTDADIIDVSNLSRQFLFRQEHVKQFKSICAASSVTKMNPSFNTVPMKDRVGPETENVFNDKFWESLDFVTNALDNVEARLYVDSKCVYYRKPLFESGTLGTMANSQTILPYLTKTYASYKDPPQAEIAQCTIHTYPNLIQHTITWARTLFESLFASDPKEMEQYLKDSKSYLENNEGNMFALQAVYFGLKGAPKTFEECVAKARIKFEELFTYAIRNILEDTPPDHKTETGGAFWSGSKRCPKIPKFDFKDFSHKQFVVSTTKLFCDVFNIEFKELKDEEYISLCEKVALPEFRRTAVKKGKEKEEKEEKKELTEEEKEKQKKYYENIINGLKDSSKYDGIKVSPVEFEKDQDDNFHMDFITGASNVRAHAYGIPEADKHKTKGIAGKVIPAMITTTALVTGFVSFEMLKFVQGKKHEDFRNSFLNLAGNTSLFSVPEEATKEFSDKWSVWDRFDVSEGKDITVGELIKIVETKYQIKVASLAYGSLPLYVIVNPDENVLKAPTAGLVQHFLGQKFDSNKKFIELFIQALVNGKVNPVPTIRYQFRFDEKKPVVKKPKV